MTDISNDMHDGPSVGNEQTVHELSDNESMKERTEECVPDTAGSSERGEIDESNSPSMHTENMSEKTEECLTDADGSSEGGELDKSDSAEDYGDLNQYYIPDRRLKERDESNRRKHERIGFTYPLQLKIFSSQLNNMTYKGYIEDISLSGAGISVEDRYGRIPIDGLEGKGAKLLVSMPHGDDISLLSTIMWIRRDTNEKMNIKVGIAFEKLEDWQLKTVKQLISLKNKDQNMMWNLFENYEKNIR